MYVYLVIQTRNVATTDYVAAICKTREIAEKWVIHNCQHYGDCISTLTGNFLIPPSYKIYAEGEWIDYMYPNNPALLIQPFEFIDN